MLAETATGNRRRHERAGIRGRALVEGATGLVRGEIVDLGAGGVLVDDAGEASLPVGAPVVVELDIARLGRLRQLGGVVRREPRRLAIGFQSPWPAVIVVDPLAPRRRDLADALRAAGCCSLEAATPLEVVDLLDRVRGVVSAVVVAESTRSAEIVGYLSDAHPGLRLQLIVDRPMPANDALRDVLAGLA